eukprot:g36394.t1
MTKSLINKEIKGYKRKAGEYAYPNGDSTIRHSQKNLQLTGYPPKDQHSHHSYAPLGVVAFRSCPTPSKMVIASTLKKEKLMPERCQQGGGYSIDNVNLHSWWQQQCLGRGLQAAVGPEPGLVAIPGMEILGCDRPGVGLSVVL